MLVEELHTSTLIPPKEDDPTETVDFVDGAGVYRHFMPSSHLCCPGMEWEWDESSSGRRGGRIAMPPQPLPLPVLPSPSSPRKRRKKQKRNVSISPSHVHPVPLPVYHSPLPSSRRLPLLSPNMPLLLTHMRRLSKIETKQSKQPSKQIGLHIVLGVTGRGSIIDDSELEVRCGQDHTR